MELAQLMILVGFIGTSSMLFYIIINICLKVIGVHAHEFCTNTDASTVAIITKYIEKYYFFSTSIHGGKPIGLIIGKYFIAYITIFKIQQRDDAKIGYSITFWSSNEGHTKSLLDDFNDTKKEISKDENIIVNTIETWRHVGAYKSDTIEKFLIPFYNNPCDEQEEVITLMKKMSETSFENGYGMRLVVMIAGPSGTGKSQIAKQFAKKINATLLDDFNPICPGQNYAALIKTIKPTHEKPLIVLIDESDKIIEEIHKGLSEHEFLVTPATNKATFNTFMDRLADSDNVIVIFTMNSTFNYIDSLDSSYIRCGRINLKINFGGDDTYNPSEGTYFHIKPFENIATTINTKRFMSKSVMISNIELQDEIKKTV